MVINTALTITLTTDRMRELGYIFDNSGNITNSPNGLWSSAIWFGNNDVDKGYLQLFDNGSVLNAQPILDSNNSVTGFNFIIPAFSQNAIRGGVMYIALASDASIKSDPFINLAEGDINNLQNAYDNNFTFGTFEFTLQGGSDDQGDLTAISTFGFPLSATSYVAGKAIDSVGLNVSGQTIWSLIEQLGSTQAPSVYSYNGTVGPLQGKAFAITPTTAVGGSFVPPLSNVLPFSANDWNAYLDALANTTSAIAHVSGTYNGAVAPVNNWVSDKQNIQIPVWHNAGFFDYEISYKSNITVQINGSPTQISGFLLSPSSASQVKGYIVIPKGDEADLAPDWNGGLANSIYSTLGMAQVYAQDPSIVAGQTPFLFQNASAANNGSATAPATTEFFNVGANTQWGKIFTQFLTGLAAGYIGSTGTPFNPLDQSGSADLSQSWNWDPTYAFDTNLREKPYGSGASFQFTDNYAKIFFQNSNIYGDMYSDNLMSLFDIGSPLLNLSSPSGGNVDEINIKIFGINETPTGYVAPKISNYPGYPGSALTLGAPSNNAGTYTLNFLNPAGGVGQQSFVLDDSRVSLSIRVWDPTLNGGTGGFSNQAILPTFPSAEVSITGMVGQEIPQGAVLTSQDGQSTWAVTSINNFIQPSAGGSLNGSVNVMVTAQSAKSALTTGELLDPLAIAFPGSVSYQNSAASISGVTSQDPATVKLRFSGDGGASFGAGYIVDSQGQHWTFPAGTINSGTGFVDVVATAQKPGLSVPANEAWGGLFQLSPSIAHEASAPGLFWSNFTANYEGGVLSFINQNNQSQVHGELLLANMPLGTNQGDIVWYQLTVTDTTSGADKVFNFYPSFNVNTVGSQNIDGGAAIALGDVTNSFTINFAGSGTDALPGHLFIPDQHKGSIPLQGTPSAPVLGTSNASFYQFLGQEVDFTALPNQTPSGSNAMSDVQPGSYVFGWTGLNPEALASGSLQTWSNKVNGLDIVQISVVDMTDPSRNQTVFSQGDLDGQWLSGLSPVLQPIGTNLNLLSKPVSLVAGHQYQISYQEFSPLDPGLYQTTPSGQAPISQVSQILTVTTSGSSSVLDVASNDIHHFVYGLYEGLLDRVPDANGFRYWSGEIHKGLQRSDIITAITHCAEYQTKWEALTNEQFVQQAYAYILDRTPDAQGQSSWLSALNSGHLSREDVLQAFLESAEGHQVIIGLTQAGYLVMN